MVCGCETSCFFFPSLCCEMHIFLRGSFFMRVINYQSFIRHSLFRTQKLSLCQNSQSLEPSWQQNWHSEFLESFKTALTAVQRYAVTTIVPMSGTKNKQTNKQTNKNNTWKKKSVRNVRLSNIPYNLAWATSKARIRQNFYSIDFSMYCCSSCFTFVWIKSVVLNDASMEQLLLSNSHIYLHTTCTHDVIKAYVITTAIFFLQSFWHCPRRK